LSALAPLNTWVTGPRARSGLAIRVSEDDHAALIHVALIRERQRESIATGTLRVLSRPGLFEDEITDLASRPVTPLSVPLLDVVKELASYSREYVSEDLLPSVSQCVGQFVHDRERAFRTLASSTSSLAALLGCFAFARQGAERAGYNEICVALLEQFKDEDPSRFWQVYPDWPRFHTAFVEGCRRRRIMPHNRHNRGLLRDLYTLAARTPQRGLFHVWADRIRKESGLAGIFDELDGVHGIGPKIASFICRDTVFLAGLEESLPPEHRKYLQPVDIWIGRIAEFLNPDLTFGRDDPAVISQFLAGASAQAGVSGVAFNQGSWHFSSQVAGSATRLNVLLAQMAGERPSTIRRTPRTLPTTSHRGRVIVISCGRHKVWDDEPQRGPCAARDAYRGPFFTVNRKYAERFAPNDWLIFSSRFGFVRPDTPITNYDATFKDPGTRPIDADQLRVSAVQLAVVNYEEVEVLAGSEYVKVLQKALRDFPVKLLRPYAGCRNRGAMMRRATSALEAGVPMDRRSLDGRPGARAGLTETPARRPGRPSSTSNPDFIRRAFALHEAGGLTQGEALIQAAREFGIALPPSYQRSPGVHFNRWRQQSHGPSAPLGL
jgi:hypothetical protein